MKKTITVITPTYKRDPKIVEKCIGSVQIQTYPFWKQIVCSDGIYEERIKNVVFNQNDQRCFYATTEKSHNNSGNGVRQEVLEKWTDTDYVMFLDDDNYILPNYMETMINAIENNNVDFAICKILHFGPLPKHLGKPPILLKNNNLTVYNVDTLQFLVKTDIMKENTWLQQGYCADGHTFEKLSKKYTHVKVNECLGVHT